MGRKKNNSSRQNMQNSRVAGSRPEKVSGRSLFTFTTTGSIVISPAAFSRALAIADVFQFYRFTKLRIKNIPTGVACTYGYAPGALFDTPPTLASQVTELPYAVNHGLEKTTDTILNIPRKELLGDSQIKWFKTIPGSPASQFEIQGNVYVVVPVTGVIMEVEYEVEFQSWNLAANSPKPNLPSADLPPASSLPTPGDVVWKNTDSFSIGGVTYKKSLA